MSQKQKILELKPDEMWELYHDKINDLMLEEKKARNENNVEECSKVCSQIVSFELFNFSSNQLLMRTG